MSVSPGHVVVSQSRPRRCQSVQVTSSVRPGHVVVSPSRSRLVSQSRSRLVSQSRSRLVSQSRSRRCLSVQVTSLSVSPGHVIVGQSRSRRCRSVQVTSLSVSPGHIVVSQSRSHRCQSVQVTSLSTLIGPTIAENHHHLVILSSSQCDRMTSHSSCACARVWSEGQELPGVGALAICICRWVCHGVRVPMGWVVLGAVRAWLLGRAVANILTKYVNMKYKKTFWEYVCSH